MRQIIDYTPFLCHVNFCAKLIQLTDRRYCFKEQIYQRQYNSVEIDHSITPSLPMMYFCTSSSVTRAKWQCYNYEVLRI